MIAYFGVILLCNGLIAWGLISLHHWLAYAVASVIIGASSALFWFFGNVQQTVEYWRGTSPRLVRFFLGNPRITEQNICKLSMRYKSNVGKHLKVQSLVLGLGFTSFFVYRSISENLYLILAIICPITWILGVFLSELYFKHSYARHRFTRIRDDSDV